jgi:hypothetical protein
MITSKVPPTGTVVLMDTILSVGLEPLFVLLQLAAIAIVKVICNTGIRKRRDLMMLI